ncbi:hypothetical protein BDM02DRAFT_3116594 [Thelephora ganbajun]|uniref:Uncharacterized protein n=1 Tax=Thelephora ganbajun TaxID=370292 RepID=A0ACB6ZDS6_THEGA|nr:hypothetical protein BDM02DRAFT_3116594 [Thelephora ganbajun]
MNNREGFRFAITFLGRSLPGPAVCLIVLLSSTSNVTWPAHTCNVARCHWHALLVLVRVLLARFFEYLIPTNANIRFGSTLERLHPSKRHRC